MQELIPGILQTLRLVLFLYFFFLEGFLSKKLDKSIEGKLIFNVYMLHYIAN